MAPILCPVDPLTAREREVLRLVMEGFSNGDIARVLVVSAETVKTHIWRYAAASWTSSHEHSPGTNPRYAHRLAGVRAGCISWLGMRSRKAVARASLTSKTPEQSPRVMNQSRTFQ
jgi:FixJ family two-component response regulator